MSLSTSAHLLAEKADRLPGTSGVYLFRDAQGVVLYVGKAKNLRARVRQYLLGQDGRFMVRFLLAAATDLEVVLTHNEKEALILENTLIKKFKPRYNVQLRDDKNFLHLRLSKGPWPRYELRRKRDPRARSFGPFASAGKARRTLDFLQRSFPLRTCTDRVLNSRQRPCLLHQLDRCVAPCVEGHTTPEAYTRLVDESVLFLKGRNEELLQALRKRMQDASESEDFESAARLRDLAIGVRATLQKQEVVHKKHLDRDVWGLFREMSGGVFVVIPVRSGLMLEPTSIPFTQAAGEDSELLGSVLNRWYAEGACPPEILLPIAPANRVALTDLLGERAGRKVRLIQPKRGEKARVLALAMRNAKDRYRRASSAEEQRLRALSELGRVLGLEGPPHHMECFDNSNIGGKHPVASQVVFLGGRPEKKAYRHYHIKTVEGPDDYASMREVLGRRFRRAWEEGVFPDLLVVDGGAGQVSIAQAVLEEIGIEGVPVIGLAKPRTEKARGEADAVDKIIIPGSGPLLLEDNHPALNLLRALRDESHRFALSFHRRTRRKNTITSRLETIPGVGPSRRKALLRQFGSLKALSAASPQEIASVDGLGPTLAHEIHRALAKS